MSIVQAWIEWTLRIVIAWMSLQMLWPATFFLFTSAQAGCFVVSNANHSRHSQCWNVKVLSSLQDAIEAALVEGLVLKYVSRGLGTSDF